MFGDLTIIGFNIFFIIINIYMYKIIILTYFLIKFILNKININSYYKQLGQTPDQISAYLGFIPIVFGIIGSFVGGFVSDRVAKKGFYF